MHDWLKKNQKKVLAVLGAFLMVSFLVNVPLSSLTRDSRHGQPYGRIGKTVIYYDERHTAEIQLHLLERSYRQDRLLESLTRMAGGDRSHVQSILDFFRSQPGGIGGMLSEMEQRGGEIMAIDRLGRGITSQFADHPELFLLLIKEAEQRGISIKSDVYKTVAKNEIHPLNDVVDENFELAVRSLLMVEALRDQILADSQGTEPQWLHFIADRVRTVNLNLVEFKVDQFKSLTPVPTTQKVNDLFEKYRNVESDGTKPADDELGFAYGVPNRVKLQYLTIPWDKTVEAAIAAHMDPKIGDKKGEIPYSLVEQAQVYYDQHLSKYAKPATQPATQPATAPVFGPFDSAAATRPTTRPATQLATTHPSATQPSTQIAATEPATKPAEPAFRPFAEVQEEIVKDLIKPEAEKLQTTIETALHDRLTRDWKAFPHSSPTTQPATKPAALAGAATQPASYETHDYLVAVAKDIQREFGVLPETTQIAEWQDATTLAKLPGIGQSETDSVPFPQLATRSLAPFVTSFSQSAPTLQLWQPSDVLKKGSDQDTYIFRATAASPAHAPPIADVRARVEEDARTMAAFNAANDAAKKFLASAKNSSFSRAALDDHRSVTSTGFFHLGDAIPNFHAGAAEQRELDAKVRDLLTQASNANPNPTTIVAMPGELRVIVVQLSDVSVAAPEGSEFQRLQWAENVQSGFGQELIASYFKLDAVIARLGFKLEESPKGGQ